MTDENVTNINNAIKPDSCLMCDYCKENPISADLQRTAACLRNPPTSHPIPAGNGQVAFITSFPQVTDKMICCEFERIPEIM